MPPEFVDFILLKVEVVTANRRALGLVMVVRSVTMLAAGAAAVAFCAGVKGASVFTVGAVVELVD